MPTIMRNGFFEGIKSNIEPSIIPENSIWRGLNVKSDLNGILRVREGSRSLFPSLGSNDIQGMISAFNGILFIYNNIVYYFEFNDMKLHTLSSDTISANSNDVEMIKWTRSGKEVVYIFTGHDIYETDGEALEVITPYTPESGEDPNMLGNDVGPQQSKYATLRASLSQRVAVSGIKESPNTVYLSSPLDITYFPLSQVIQLPDDGGKITGITNWYNALVIFRDKDIWAFFGSSLTDESASLVLQDGSVGCTFPDTITHVPNIGICFVGPDNIYALQGVSGVENQSKAVPIGDDVVNLIKNSIKESNDKATSIYFDGEYIVSFPYAQSNEKIYRLDLENNISWYVDSGPPNTNYVVHDRELYGTYVNYGVIHHITDETLYDDVPYVIGEENKPIPLSVTFRRENVQPGPARIKRIFLYVMSLGRVSGTEMTFFGPVFNSNMYGERREENVSVVMGTEQHFKVTAMVDGNEFIIDNFNINSKRMDHQLLSKSEPVRIYEARIRPSLKGHFIQLKVEANMPGELIAILGYGIEYQPKGRIRGKREGVTNNKDW